MKIAKVLGVAIIATLFVACCPCRKGLNKGVASFVGNEWQLVQIGTKTVQPTAAGEYVLSFSKEGVISGKGSCNRLSGAFTYNAEKSAGKINVGNLASTRMACPDQAAESAFIKRLESVSAFQLDGKLLILTGSDEKMIFEKR